MRILGVASEAVKYFLHIEAETKNQDNRSKELDFNIFLPK